MIYYQLFVYSVRKSRKFRVLIFEQLTPDKYTITPLLDTLFTGMYTGRICGKESTRISRLKISQDLVYGIARGRVKTPKHILFTSAIKTLTNCTE